MRWNVFAIYDLIKFSQIRICAREMTPTCWITIALTYIIVAGINIKQLTLIISPEWAWINTTRLHYITVTGFVYHRRSHYERVIEECNRIAKHGGFCLVSITTIILQQSISSIAVNNHIHHQYAINKAVKSNFIYFFIVMTNLNINN